MIREMRCSNGLRRRASRRHCGHVGNFSGRRMGCDRCLYRRSGLNLSTGPTPAHGQSELRARVIAATGEIGEHSLGAIGGPTREEHMALAIQWASSVRSDKSLISHGSP